MTPDPSDLPTEQRTACRVVAEALRSGRGLVRPGARLVDVAEEIEATVRSRDAEMAFPVNVSIDEQAAHYTPRTDDPRTFEAGQVVKLDCGAHVDGWIGDSAVTVEVGGAGPNARLVKAAEAGLDRALSVVRNGVPLKEIGQTVEAAISSYGYRPISNLTGHTIERYHLHAGTSIPSVPSGGGGRLTAGTVCAIEPFATDGRGKIDNGEPGHIYHFVRERPVKDDAAAEVLERVMEAYDKLPFAERWLTADLGRPTLDDLERLRKIGAVKAYPILVEVEQGRVAQAEHTVLVTPDGCEVLTRA